MNIKTIVIEGRQGDIEITRNRTGAYVMAGKLCIAAFERTEEPAARYVKAMEVAKAIYGADRNGRLAATPGMLNSMVHDVMSEIERVAGC